VESNEWERGGKTSFGVGATRAYFNFNRKWRGKRDKGGGGREGHRGEGEKRD